MTADELNKTADEHFQHGRYEEAESAAVAALNVARLSGNSLQAGRAAVFIGNIAQRHGEYLKALEQYQLAHESFEVIGDSGRIAITLGNIGRAYRNLSDYTTAAEYYRKALALDEELGNWRGVADHTGNLGNLFLLMSDYPNALVYYQKALSLAEQTGNAAAIAIHTGNLGNIFLLFADYPNALSLFHKSLALAEASNNMSDTATQLGNIGNIYLAMKEYNIALDYYHKALMTKEQLGDKVGAASLTGNIAAVHFYLHDYTMSLQYYKRALGIHNELGNKAGVADVYVNIGSNCKMMGDHAGAMDYCNKALELYTEVNNIAGIANCTQNIAGLYSDDDNAEYDPVLAERYFLRAKELFEELGAKKELYETHYCLAVLFQLTRNWEKAFTHHQLFYALEKEVLNEETKKQAERLNYERKTAEREKQAAIERTRLEATEQLLHNVLPPEIAGRILGGTKLIADKLDTVSVLFADIVEFTSLSQDISPEELVKGLNAIFTIFDELAEKYGLEKIKTMGDAYMVVSGAPIPRSDHAQALAIMAFDMMEAVSRFNPFLTGKPLRLRIGIHSGEVVAGVIGKNKYTYDLWGDAVNTASRMESHSEAGKIHCTEDFVRELRMRNEELRMKDKELTGDNSQFIIFNSQFIFVPRGEMEIKGKGMMKTYFLEKAD
ncbi:MAG: tetratricopeptide repeat protein [Ignavibacteria bacterium]|jgi:adenylate cyclase|nr:tetratricopeptide repeat protein [Ignavibacteria bacterium]